MCTSKRSGTTVANGRLQWRRKSKVLAEIEEQESTALDVDIIKIP